MYERYGMIRRGALFAHCLHLNSAEWERLATAGATAVHCPSSNLFLGSGLFDFATARRVGATVALGSDVGGGTSFSMLRTMHEAQKVAQMRRLPFDALDGFYLATLGGARALGLGPAYRPASSRGREADFVVLRNGRDAASGTAHALAETSRSAFLL